MRLTFLILLSLVFTFNSRGDSARPQKYSCSKGAENIVLTKTDDKRPIFELTYDNFGEDWKGGIYASDPEIPEYASCVFDHANPYIVKCYKVGTRKMILHTEVEGIDKIMFYFLQEPGDALIAPFMHLRVGKRVVAQASFTKCDIK